LCDIQSSASRFPRSIDFAFHPRLVTLEKRQVVAVDQKIRELHLALRDSPQRILGFYEPAKRHIVDSKTIIGK
jgi:hypothetical protein